MTEVYRKGVRVQGSAERRSGSVYLDYSQEELDRAYTQALWAPNMQSLIDGWTRDGAACRDPGHGYAEHAYGPRDCERLDVFDAAGPIVHLHLHGGAWQRQSKEDCSFIAPAMRRLDVPFVVPEFGRLPDQRMPEVFDQIVAAMVWTYQTYVASGRAEGIVVSGHSSGAHMAALVASHDFGPALPVSALRAVLCISGPYDLYPVLLSTRRSYIDLTPAEAERLSPIRRVAQTRVPLHLIFGSRESPEFVRQSRAFAAALAGEGKLAACVEVAGANHFEVADQLGSHDSDVGFWLTKLLTMPHSAADLPPVGGPAPGPGPTHP
ncbi:alpha/beta hydrolase [Roseivivax jejudonensis]|uniref:alpha/beta hydrolase n=1 Tax=Roseivivax jejudonensis TaxID=1529041 RepID=UPI0013564BC5|nr:alpha/beta hydrolase [Roseivivax jejudonensis]